MVLGFFLNEDLMLVRQALYHLSHTSPVPVVGITDVYQHAQLVG
jgi:hypothetical protein